MNNLLLWSIALVVGFPLCTIGLGEVIHRLRKQGHPLAATLRLVRNLIFPVLICLLFMRQVLQLQAESQVIKAVETLLWVVVIHAALSLLNAMLFEQAEADTWRSRVPKLLIDLSRLILILVGTAIVLATVWHLDLAGLATALGVSSIVLGLALQDTLGSVTSGIALLFERPFSVGDWLKIGDKVGKVIDMNWRAVRLITLEQEMLVIPHKVISGEIIRNFSQPQPLHAERIQLGFSYDDPPNLAKEVLLNTALMTQGILSLPEPQVFTLAYSDSSITYEVKFFIEDYSHLEVIRDRFMTRIWYAAQRHHLSIPFPIRTLYHFDGPTVQTQNSTQKFNQSLQSIPAFVPIDQTPPNGQTPPDGILLQHFGAGENIVRQGYASHALYIIITGQAVLSTTNSWGEDQVVLTLKSGDFFGVTTLFSDELSTVAVTAAQDLEVMMIPATIVHQMLDRQPQFARELSQILELRRRAIQSVQIATP
jgi:small-conductance mechanosensitive channel